MITEGTPDERKKKCSSVDSCGGGGITANKEAAEEWIQGQVMDPMHSQKKTSGHSHALGTYACQAMGKEDLHCRTCEGR